jgi:hypothetical protein
VFKNVTRALAYANPWKDQLPVRAGLVAVRYAVAIRPLTQPCSTSGRRRAIKASRSADVSAWSMASATVGMGRVPGITPESCHGDAASPERLEGSPHLLAEDSRLLPGREVSALVDLVEVDDVRVARLDPAAR